VICHLDECFVLLELVLLLLLVVQLQDSWTVGALGIIITDEFIGAAFT